MVELKKQRLKKNVGAIHHVAIGKQLSLTAKKLYNLLCYVSHQHLQERETHEVKVRELCDYLGFNSHNTDCLKAALRALVSAQIEWNVLGDVNNEKWGVTTALAHAEIQNGVCSYSYSEPLREKLANPQVFALINLHVQQRFKSTHTWSLYENVVRYRNIGKTPVLPIETLLCLLGLAETKVYKEYKYLKRDVLKPAIKEINEKGDIQVEMLPPERRKRRVVALQFTVKGKQRESKSSGSPQVNRLQSFGITGKQADDAIERLSEKRIQQLLDVIEAKYKQGKVQKIREYTLQTLKNADELPVAPIQQEQEAGKLIRKQVKNKEDRLLEEKRAQQRKFDQIQKQRVCEAMKALSAEDLRNLEQEFVANLEKESNVAFGLFKKKGLDDALVSTLFHNFKVKKLLRQDEPD